MSRYPGGYSRWPSIRKGETCEAQYETHRDNPFRGTLHLKKCGKPAFKMVYSCAYMVLCEECFARLKDGVRTKESYLV